MFPFSPLILAMVDHISKLTKTMKNSFMSSYPSSIPNLGADLLVFLCMKNKACRLRRFSINIMLEVQIIVICFLLVSEPTCLMGLVEADRGP